MTSTPAATSASMRASVSPPTPTAAPTSSCSSASLAALGLSRAFWMSLTVIMPLRAKSSSTTSTFSMRWRCISSSTSSSLAPSRTVTSLSLRVMMFLTGSSSFFSKRMSRLVTMPTTLPPSTTGTPEMLRARVSLSTSPMVVCGVTVKGSRMTPASKFLTIRTCAACSCTDMFLWTMPMPPSWAMAMARRPSVTVSMAADTIGRFSLMPRVRRVARLTSLGRTVEWAGTRETSSKVSASAWMRSMGGSGLRKRGIIACRPASTAARRLQRCRPVGVPSAQQGQGQARPPGDEQQRRQQHQEEGDAGPDQGADPPGETVGGDEQVHAHRRGEVAQLQVGQHDDAQVHRVDAEGGRHRQQQRHQDHHRREDVQQHAHGQQEQVEQQQEGQRAFHVPAQPFEQPGRYLLV